MEKTFSFSIFKEKIIKTNELLAVVLEKNKSLEKSQKWIQHLKTRLELTKNEVNTLKLRNETLIFNSSAVEKNFEALQLEYNELKEKFNQLESESGATINNLQVNYQLANQELKDCKQKLSTLNETLERDGQDNSPTKRGRGRLKKKKSPVRKKESGENTNEFLKTYQKVVDLQAEKEKLVSEKTDLQLEVYELKKKLSDLSFFQDDFCNKEKKFELLGKELEELKHEYSNNVKTKDKEIQKLKDEIRNLQNEFETQKDAKNKEILILQNEIKNLEQQKTELQCENEKLNDENCSFQVELSMLQTENSYKVEQTRNSHKVCSSPTDSEIMLIMNEMIIPPLINPSISEPTESESPNYELERIVNKRRKLRKKRQRRLQKRFKNVDLYGALLALKKANINFIISNDSLLTPKPLPNRYYKPNKNVIKPKTSTTELECNLSCCKKSFMVVTENCDLVGFVGVKNEQEDCNFEQKNENINDEIVKNRRSKRRKSAVSPEVGKKQKTKKIDEILPIIETKSPKRSFKRPVCSTRRSERLVELKVQKEVPIDDFESPQSPPPEPLNQPKPTLIPLEKTPEIFEKMPTSKLEMLFNKLILYSTEEDALNEVVQEFQLQEPAYVAGAILERVALDYHDSPDTKYSPAPLMTNVQRIMLGFMSKLEKSNVVGVFEAYLTLAEHKLLTCKNLQEYGPVTRLYLAICKLHKNLTRMRKLCCDVFYFCEDFAIPFLFIVLTSWTEVLPFEPESKDYPIARVLVQIVFMKDCNKPGFNLMPLRDLLHKFYGYPAERWDYNEFFKELFDEYLKNPCRSSDFALLLYCRNRPEKWVYEKIDEHLKPLVSLNIQDNFKASLVILIGNLYHRFSSKSEINYLPKIRDWFKSLINENTPDVVKRSIYLCLTRLKKN